MTDIMSPCKGCSERVLHCHSSCERYKQYKDTLEDYKAKKAAENDNREFIISLKAEVKRRADRKERKKKGDDMEMYIDFGEIRRRYYAKGDRYDCEFCEHAGIRLNTFKNQKYKARMSLKTALLIADYLNCSVNCFAFVRNVEKSV